MKTTSRLCGCLGLAFAVLIWTGCANDSSRGLFPESSFTSSEATNSTSAPAGSRLTIWHESFDVAADQARKEGKLVLADFTGSDWCGWCIKLKKDVFSKPEFQAWARENVVLLELDYPKSSIQSQQIKEQNKMLKTRYGINSYPTVLLLDPNGDVRGKMAYSRGDTPASWIARAETQFQQANNSRFIAREPSGQQGSALR